MIIAGWSAYPGSSTSPRSAGHRGPRWAPSSWWTWRTSPAWSPRACTPTRCPRHVVTTTTHKTLGGPRGGVILATRSTPKKINSAVFPGQQGGPLEHVIAAKAVAFKLAATPEFKERQERVLQGSKLLAERLLRDDVAAAGISVVNGGTDVHLALWTCATPNWTGSRPRTCCTGWASRSTGTPSRSTPARRWCPPGSGSAPRPWPPAASARWNSPRSRTSSRRR